MKIKKEYIRYGKYIILIIVILYLLSLIKFDYDYSLAISYGSGPVFSNNWWEAMHWLKNNTQPCAVIATYWDPGHFITGVSKRFSVFGGGNQNAKRTIVLEGNLTNEQMDNYSVTGKYTFQKFKKDGKVYTSITTARIQDISTALFTSDENVAVKLLDKYDYENCSDPMYFLVSSDLIGKSHWWTYFSTWDPVKKGTAYVYSMLPLTRAEPVIKQNAIKYIYNIDKYGQRAFEVFETNGTLTTFLRQSKNYVKVKHLAYFDKNNMLHYVTNDDGELAGTVWIGPSKKTMIYIPPELEKSMFTRLFFFNGVGLRNFKLVGDWGGEVKIYKVNLSASNMPY